MKRLLTLMFLMFTAVCFSQELTADTVATPITWGEWAMGILTMAFGFLMQQSRGLIPKATMALSVWLKTWNHWRGSAVVVDTLVDYIATLGEATRVRFLDGKMSDAELKSLNELVTTEATSRLKNLFGFYKDDLEGWAKEQVGVAMGKFLLRGSVGSASVIR